MIKSKKLIIELPVINTITTKRLKIIANRIKTD
jgi:hypothetical protein